MSCPKSTNRRDVSAIESCNADPVKLAISPTTIAGCRKFISCNASSFKLAVTPLPSVASDDDVSCNASATLLTVRRQYFGCASRHSRIRRPFSSGSRWSAALSDRYQRRWLASFLAWRQSGLLQYFWSRKCRISGMYNSRQHLHLRFRRRFLGYWAFMEEDPPRNAPGLAEEKGQQREGKKTEEDLLFEVL